MPHRRSQVVTLEAAARPDHEAAGPHQPRRGRDRAVDVPLGKVAEDAAKQQYAARLCAEGVERLAHTPADAHEASRELQGGILVSRCHASQSVDIDLRSARERRGAQQLRRPL